MKHLVSNFFHLIVENSKTYSVLHSLVLTNQDKPIFAKLFESKSPQIQSICHLHKNIIAVGGINNEIEIFSFLKVDDDKVVFGKTIETLKTHHLNGIHCITVFENWFISGGGNGSFIIWSIESLQMLNVIFDNKAGAFPVVSVIHYNCSFGENILCCCYRARGIGFWTNETDLENKEGKKSISQ